MEPFSMVESVKTIGSSFPFMLAVGADPRVNKTRLLEAGIQAVVVGVLVAGLGYFVAFPVLQNQVANIAARQDAQYIQIMQTLMEYKRERELLVNRRDAQVSAHQDKIERLQSDVARMKR